MLGGTIVHPTMKKPFVPDFLITECAYFVYSRAGTDRTGLSSLSSRPPPPPPFPRPFDTTISCPEHVTSRRKSIQTCSLICRWPPCCWRQPTLDQSAALIELRSFTSGTEPANEEAGMNGAGGTRKVCLNKVDTLKQTRYSLVYIAGKMGRTNSSLYPNKAKEQKCIRALQPP